MVSGRWYKPYDVTERKAATDQHQPSTFDCCNVVFRHCWCSRASTRSDWHAGQTGMPGQTDMPGQTSRQRHSVPDLFVDSFVHRFIWLLSFSTPLVHVCFYACDRPHIMFSVYPFVCPSICLLLKLWIWYFENKLNGFLCQLARMVHEARAWNGQLWGSRDQMSESHKAETDHKNVFG